MSLVVPDLTDFLGSIRVSRVSDTGWTTEVVEDALQAATDLLEIASGVSVEPEPGTVASRMKRRAILEMAHFLLVTFDDKEEMFSPFQSERLGSYSYSKAAQAVASREATGVPMFDAAVAFLRDGDENALISLESERVFTAPNPGEEDGYDLTFPYYFGREYGGGSDGGLVRG